VETDADAASRHRLLREIGYKLWAPALRNARCKQARDARLRWLTAKAYLQDR